MGLLYEALVMNVVERDYVLLINIGLNVYVKRTYRFKDDREDVEMPKQWDSLLVDMYENEEGIETCSLYGYDEKTKSWGPEM